MHINKRIMLKSCNRCTQQQKSLIIFVYLLRQSTLLWMRPMRENAYVVIFFFFTLANENLACWIVETNIVNSFKFIAHELTLRGAKCESKCAKAQSNFLKQRIPRKNDLKKIERIIYISNGVIYAYTPHS